MGIILGLISTLVFSFYNILSTVISVKAKNPIAVSIVFNLICGAISIVIGIFELDTLHTVDWSIYALIALSLVAYTIFTRYEFLNASENESSIRTIFQPITPLTTTVIGLLFYGESITLFKIIGILLIVLANSFAVIQFDKGSFLSKKGVAYLLLTYIPLGIAWSIDRKVATQVPISLYLSITYIAPALINILLLKIPVKSIFEEINISSWRIYVLSLLQVVGYYLFVWALTLGDSSTMSFVPSMGGLFTLVLAVVLLNERGNILIKMIALLGGIIGIIFLQF